MTLKEFSDNFDTLLNSYANKAVFGDQASRADIVLDEYEKSVFLTKAQEELVTALYNGKNPYQDSFESTEEQRRYLSNLVMEDSLTPITNTCGALIGMNGKSAFFTLPDDLWFITYEAVKLTSDDECMNGAELDVIPVTQDKFHRTKRNPFRGTTTRRALRLDLADGVIEVVCDYTIANYYLRYLRKPCPIILEDLPDGLSIDNNSARTACELNDALHQRILENAVMLALRSKGISLQKEK